jgi:hypothetical protein
LIWLPPIVAQQRIAMIHRAVARRRPETAPARIRRTHAGRLIWLPPIVAQQRIAMIHQGCCPKAAGNRAGPDSENARRAIDLAASDCGSERIAMIHQGCPKTAGNRAGPDS